MIGPVSDVKRLRNVLGELTIMGEIKEEFMIEKEAETDEDKRRMLTDVAEALAGQVIIGVTGDERYREICRY